MHTILANGLRFAYFEEGSGPLVLLLHGFPDSAHSWDIVRPAIAAAGYRVVAPFMRGYHPTEIPDDGAFDSDTLGRDVLALISAFGERRAIIVGHDWGASAAYSAVGIESEKIELLITMAVPHPAGIRPSPRVLWAMRHFLRLRRKGAAAKIRRNEFSYIDELVRRWSPAWDVPPEETEHAKTSLSHPGSLEAATAYYAAIGLGLPAAQRRKVEVPAVAIAGEEDVLPPALYDRARGRYLARYEVKRVPGGHFMHREHPAECIEALLSAIEKRDS